MPTSRAITPQQSIQTTLAKYLNQRCQEIPIDHQRIADQSNMSLKQLDRARNLGSIRADHLITLCRTIGISASALLEHATETAYKRPWKTNQPPTDRPIELHYCGQNWPALYLKDRHGFVISQAIYVPYDEVHRWRELPPEHILNQQLKHA